ncbi:sensor histidine kinase [Vagococcus acidifermentans]|uniref:HAMP domain-containing protein n=1 Tax=Vagococcus acidifermentans TaxID=564710 RepID=A0A430B0I3_9ENTE|nr:histidine kinase [Vagococcus acidifermentans]RSU13850.1 hypothetical protein CBF27_02820 [Vagococcus acidifermentans]
MKKTFKEILQKEIKRKYSVFSLIVSGLVLLMFFSFIFFNQNYQLKIETDVIKDEWQHIKTKSHENLRLLNSRSIPNVIRGKEEDRKLYEEFYRITSEEHSRGVLWVMNQKGDLVFESASFHQPSAINEYYLRIVINSSKNANSITRVAMDNNYNHYLVIMEKIIEKGEELGYSILLLNGNDFLPNSTNYGTQFIIADSYDNVFSRSSNHFIKGSLEKIDTIQLEKGLFYEDNALYLSKKTNLKENMYLYTYSLFLPLPALIIFGIIFIILLTGIMLFLSFHLARKIADTTTKNIDTLVEETKEVSEGIKPMIQMETGDEFEFLAESINEMVSKLGQLHQQTLHFERKMLEAQFNPHFLYNTLENIRITSQIEPEVAQELIFSLRRVLQHSIDHSDEEVTLQDDLDVIVDFLRVNVVRFDKLTYKVSLSEELKELKIPRLFLLPLVENSLKYGMKVREDVHIEIKVYQTDSEIFFEVSDNGPGFPTDLIEEIYFQYENKGSHHGLINSYRRLKMSFPYTDLRIFNHSDGATVQLVIIKERV